MSSTLHVSRPKPPRGPRGVTMSHSHSRGCSPNPSNSSRPLLQRFATTPITLQSKYRVLPAIEKKTHQETQGTKVMETLEPSTLDRVLIPADQSQPQQGGTSLLLAIRTPSGRRFQQIFHTAETLRAVLEAAQAQSHSSYQHCTVQTADVPRRRFTDLSHTLAQSGIQNRSVLYISEDYTSADTFNNL